jgi:SAM-dependent methyltransferase
MAHKNWDKFYNQHGRFYLLPHPALPEFMEKLNDNNAKKILDLGCGSGRHLITLSENDFEAEGVDFSPSAVRMANEWLESRGLPGRAVVANIHEKLQTYKTASFDGILAINSLHYQSSDNLLKSLKEINRLLKTGGIALLVMPSKDALISRPDLEQIFVNEEALKIALKNRLEILNMYLDEDKCFVVVAQETKKA